MPPTPVSVLGLGVMGRALAAALLAAGHPVAVWNRTPGRAAGLDGVRVAPTVPDAVRSAPVVVTCLLDDDAVTSALDGAGPDLAGRVLVDLTTTTPDQARARAAWAAGHGAAHLDGGIMAVPPMIGSPDALVLYGGPAPAFEDARDALSAFGRPVLLGDDPGTAPLHDVALLSAMYGLLGGALQAFGLVRSAGGTATGLLPLLRPWLDAMLSTLDGTAALVDDGPDGTAAVSPLAMQSAAFGTLRTTYAGQGVRDDLLVPVQRLLAEAVAAGHGDRDVDALVDLLAPDAAVPAGR